MNPFINVPQGTFLQKKVNNLSKRQVILINRINRLQDAIDTVCKNASNREVFELDVFSKISYVLSYERNTSGFMSAVLDLGYKTELVKCMRVGRHFGDEFYELKLWQTQRCFVMFVNSRSRTPLFVKLTAFEAVGIYTGLEIQRLIKLLHTL
jgi:hypothetical protein